MPSAAEILQRRKNGRKAQRLCLGRYALGKIHAIIRNGNFHTCLMNLFIIIECLSNHFLISDKNNVIAFMGDENKKNVNLQFNE
jgi:hypothetical protein